MHWLAEHAQKSGKYRFTKFRRLAGRDPKEGAKNYFEVTHSNSKGNFKKKTKDDYQTDKNYENGLYLILGALVGRARPKII